MLTRPQMEKTIKEGGSVLHKGKVLARIEDLPTAAELAQGDQEKLRAELASVNRQIAALEGQRTALQDSLKASEPKSAEPKAPEPKASAEHAGGGDAGPVGKPHKK